MRTVVRTLLVYYLGAAAALLSFDALRARALGEATTDTDVIPDLAILPRPVLASVWASVIDVAAAAGILGLQANRKDRTAWAMFLTASAASVGFQMFTPWVALGRAVPPVALFLAVVVLKLSGQPTEEPAPSTAGTVAAAAAVSTPASAQLSTPPRRRTPAKAVKGRPDARTRVRALLDTEDPTVPWTAGRLAGAVGVSRSRAHTLLTEERARRNGDTPA